MRVVADVGGDHREVGVLERGPGDGEGRDLATRHPGRETGDLGRGRGRRETAADAVLLPRDGGLLRAAPAERLGGVDGQQATGGDDTDPVGEVLGLVEVVGGEQDRGALGGERADQAPEVAAGLRVEACRGLVEEEQVGSTDDAERDVEAAPLATAQADDPGVGLVVEADRGEHVGDVAGVRVGLRGAGQRLARGQQVKASGRLQHDPHPVAPREPGPLRVGAEHPHVTGVPVAEPLGDLDGGRLAGAVRAEQGEALAGADVEVEPVDGGPPRVGLGESPDGDRVCHASSVLPVGPWRDARAVDLTSTDRWTRAVEPRHPAKSGSLREVRGVYGPDSTKCS